MKFKSALAALIAVSALGTCVHAAGVRTEVNGTKVTLTASTAKNTKANIIVSRKNADIGNNANIYEMIQVTADGNGQIKHTFTVPESRGGNSSYGEYNVYIKPEGKEMLTGEFAYVTDDDITDLMTIVTASDANFEEIFAPDSEQRVSLKAIGCLMSKYDALADKSGVIAAVEDGVNASTSSADFVSTFNGAITMASITNSASADEALEIYSPKFDGKSYIDFDEARKNFVASTICAYLPFSSPADFNAKYEKVNALYEVNTAKFDKMSDTLDEYKTILEINNSEAYEEYCELSYSKKITASEELVKSFKKAKVTTTQELINAIKAANKEANKNKGGSGGSSGSGGVGSGFVSAGPETINPQPGANNNASGNFNDLDDVSWAKEAILALKDKGIVSGTGDGKFGPNDTVTREAFTKMIVMASGLYTPGETADFDDISPDDWCYSYVASAFNNKLVYGVSETTFGKGSNISRQDMAVIAYRAAKNSGKLHVGREMTVFEDDNLIADYAREAVEALYTAGVLNGSDGMLRPLSTATRAEAAVIIYNLFVK